MDIDRLLAPVAGDNPSGVELRNDPRFHSVERLLDPAAREYRLNDDGSVNPSAPAVEWHTVLEQGQELAESGRDLRLLVMLVRAQYNTDGFGGMVEGLDMLSQSITQYWDSLYPELRDRPDPKAAAMPRMNALRQLENDANGLLGDLRFGTVLNPRGIGPISGDDLSVATLSDFEVLSRTVSGLSQAEKDAVLAEHEQSSNRVNAACRAMASEDGETAAQMIADLKACEHGIADLIKAVGTAAGMDEGLGLALPELTEFLGLCRKTIEAAVRETNGGAAPVEDNPAASVAAVTAAGAAPAAGGVPGTINSREDVARVLEQVVAFYERTEPSSPIPHLARRLRRMVSMDFMELMEEIAPAGLKEFYNVAGVEPKKK